MWVVQMRRQEGFSTIVCDMQRIQANYEIRLINLYHWRVSDPMTAGLSLSRSNFIKQRITKHVRHGDQKVSAPLITIVRRLECLVCWRTGSLSLLQRDTRPASLFVSEQLPSMARPVWLTRSWRWVYCVQITSLCKCYWVHSCLLWQSLSPVDVPVVHCFS